MTSLMDLPMELLSQILEEVGGSNLRRDSGAARLCVCQRWYTAAKPVYLSGLGTTDINVFAHNLSGLDISGKFGYGGLRALMHKNTRHLRLRLLGHYWDEASSSAYDENAEQTSSGSAGEQFFAQINEPPFDFDLPENVHALEVWRDDMLKPRLDALFTDLRNFEACEELIFEATSDPEVGYHRGPHWDYLSQSSVLKLLTNLPITHGLKSLTLDISGMKDGLMDSDTDICQSIARVLPRIENVRLRMHNLCPNVLGIEDDLSPNEVRLRNLVIKLYLPSFAYTEEGRVQPCEGMSGPRTGHALLQSLARTSAAFLKKLASLRQTEAHGIEGFRISYVSPHTSTVSTLDCLTMKLQMLPGQFFLYEDDGKPNWYELSRAHEMLYGGEFRYSNRLAAGDIF